MARAPIHETHAVRMRRARLALGEHLIREAESLWAARDYNNATMVGILYRSAAYMYGMLRDPIMQEQCLRNAKSAERGEPPEAHHQREVS